MQKSRYHIQCWGRVQGMGLRSHIQRKAHELHLKGYVKNKADGSVIIEAEGPESKIIALINHLKSNPGYIKINRLEIDKQVTKNEFDSFDIHY